MNTGIPYGGPYVCRGCGVFHIGPNTCEQLALDLMEDNQDEQA